MSEVIKAMFGKGVATPFTDDLIATMIEQAAREDKKPDSLILTNELNVFLADAGVNKDRPLGFMMGYINGDDVEAIKFRGDGYNEVFNEYLNRLMDGDMDLHLFVVQLDKHRTTH
tara:strand:+ start:1052 stop:1396 length:345 start_codon:yes stop_codon:yes gene_type:complete